MVRVNKRCWFVASEWRSMRYLSSGTAPWRDNGRPSSAPNGVVVSKWWPIGQCRRRRHQRPATYFKFNYFFTKFSVIWSHFLIFSSDQSWTEINDKKRKEKNEMKKRNWQIKRKKRTDNNSKWNNSNFISNSNKLIGIFQSKRNKRKIVEIEFESKKNAQLKFYCYLV